MHETIETSMKGRIAPWRGWFHAHIRIPSTFNAGPLSSTGRSWRAEPYASWNDPPFSVGVARSVHSVALGTECTARAKTVENERILITSRSFALLRTTGWSDTRLPVRLRSKSVRICSSNP
jgi:hypothetical protein